jgi:two-component sensor histidine kinase
MSSSSIEPPPVASADAGIPRDELLYRLRQQSLLGEFARHALQSRDFGQILQRATELCAQGMQTKFAKVLEYIAENNRLLVRAGVGWAPGTVGVVSLGPDIESPAGFAYQTGEAVVSNHLEAETRFRTPKLLSDHGIKRAINVLIPGGGKGNTSFGVLEVDSADPGKFDAGDASYLEGFAALLGIAIERQQADAELQRALEHQALLTREMSHRVKNSLTSVVGLLRVQARSAPSQDIRNALDDASARVNTIAQVHDHIWRGARIGFIELTDFMSELCKNLQGTAPDHMLRCQAENLTISADHAIPLGLIINELVTNAVKYAYPGGHGVVHVTARALDGLLHLEVADEGVGLPGGFDIDMPRSSLGFKVIKGLVRQLKGQVRIVTGPARGARFVLDLPILAPT